jgi:hypothetical protein
MAALLVCVSGLGIRKNEVPAVFGPADKSSHDMDPLSGAQHRRNWPPAVPGLDELKPRGLRSRADELKYFAVSTSCLQCRRTVQAPVDKLHYKLRCPHCGMLMHLREDGKWYAGVHPSLQAPGKAAARSSRTGVLEHWRQLSGRARRGVQLAVAAMLVCIILLGVMHWGNSQSKAGPATIEEQAQRAVRAILTDNDSAWSELLADGTEGPGGEWLSAIQERLRSARPDGRPVQSVELEMLFLNWTERQAAVAAEFHCGRETVHCVLIWILAADNQWRLDGRRTLEDLRVTAPAAAIEDSSTEESAP